MSDSQSEDDDRAGAAIVILLLAVTGGGYGGWQWHGWLGMLLGGGAGLVAGIVIAVFLEPIVALIGWLQGVGMLLLSSCGLVALLVDAIWSNGWVGVGAVIALVVGAIFVGMAFGTRDWILGALLLGVVLAVPAWPDLAPSKLPESWQFLTAIGVLVTAAGFASVGDSAGKEHPEAVRLVVRRLMYALLLVVVALRIFVLPAPKPAAEKLRGRTASETTASRPTTETAVSAPTTATPPAETAPPVATTTPQYAETAPAATTAAPARPEKAEALPARDANAGPRARSSVRGVEVLIVGAALAIELLLALALVQSRRDCDEWPFAPAVYGVFAIGSALVVFTGAGGWLYAPLHWLLTAGAPGTVGLIVLALLFGAGPLALHRSEWVDDKIFLWDDPAIWAVGFGSLLSVGAIVATYTLAAFVVSNQALLWTGVVPALVPIAVSLGASAIAHLKG